jgi:flagellar hook-associated protein 2
MKGGADMANAITNSVYNQFSTTYMQKKNVGRYDTHKRSELRTLCSSMAKINRDAPLYLIDRG